MKTPGVGELNKRLKIKVISHSPVGEHGIQEDIEREFTVWAKQDVIGSNLYYESVTVNDIVSHRFTIRAVKGKSEPKDLSHITRLECEGIEYLLKRVSSLQAQHRFTVLDVCEVGLNKVVE